MLEKVASVYNLFFKACLRRYFESNFDSLDHFQSQTELYLRELENIYIFMQLPDLLDALIAYTGTNSMNKPASSKHTEFMQLYNQSHARLTRYVQSVVYNKADVKDIVSETVMRVYEKFETIEKKESFIYYLFKTASRLITELHKKQNRYTELDDEMILQLPAPIINTTLSLEIKDLYSALSQLPFATREAIVLFEIDGFSQLEICSIQGGTLSGVKSRITRGREALKKIIIESETVKTA